MSFGVANFAYMDNPHKTTAQARFVALSDIFSSATPMVRVALVLKQYLLAKEEPFAPEGLAQLLITHGVLITHGGEDAKVNEARIESYCRVLRNRRKGAVTSQDIEELLWNMTDLDREQANKVMEEALILFSKLESGRAFVEMLGTRMGAWLDSLPRQPGATRITFGDSGKPTIVTSPKVVPTPSPAPPLPDPDVEQCATKLLNSIRIQDNGVATHDFARGEMAGRGFSSATIRAATAKLNAEGKIEEDVRSGTLRVTQPLPSTVREWTQTAHALSCSKGFYDGANVSVKAAEALAKLSPEDRTELLQYLPTGTYEPKTREDVGKQCNNLNSEVSELWEAYRKGDLDKPCDKADKMISLGLPPLTCAEEELADVAIRACDVAELWGIDLERAMRVKHILNESRGHRHGGKLA